MTEIIINKGFVSHEGQIYGAGEVVSIMDDKEAKHLVANSDGDFAFYRGNVSDSGTQDKEEPVENAADDVSDSDTEDAEAEATGDGLPALDPNAAMQTTKDGKGGKGKKK